MGFLVVNIISLIMFGITILLIFMSEHVGLGIACGVLWLIYTVVANLVLLKSHIAIQSPKKITPSRLNRSDSRGLFRKQVRRLQQQYESINSRKEFMSNTTDSMQELYERIMEQAESNIDSAAAYMESYDYYTKPEPVYLNRLCNQGDELVNRFNTLVEQLVDIDTNPTTLDMAYVDDVVDCLKEMQTQTM